MSLPDISPEDMQKLLQIVAQKGPSQPTETRFEVPAIVDDDPAEFPRKKRAGNFVPDEDTQICKSWLAVSQEASTGTDQKACTFWDKVQAHFHEHLGGVSRSSRSIQQRWGLIQASVAKFCGYFEQVERLNQSGKTFENKIQDAMALYLNLQGKKFLFFTSWTTLRHAQKFKLLLTAAKKPAGSSTPAQRSRTVSYSSPVASTSASASMSLSPSSCPSSDNEEQAKNVRPKGKKAAKMEKKEVPPAMKQTRAIEDLAIATTQKAAALAEMNESMIMKTIPAGISDEGKEYFMLINISDAHWSSTWSASEVRAHNQGQYVPDVIANHRDVCFGRHTREDAETHINRMSSSCPSASTSDGGENFPV